MKCVNCPIQEQTVDGRCVGRCWFYLPDGKTCPRHGDVSVEVKTFLDTGRTTKESERNRAVAGMPVINTGPTVVVVPATNAGEIVTNVRGPD